MTGQFEVGRRFGAYVLGEQLGRGGMGVVYQAEHVHLGRTVALKLLAPELSESADFRARFLRESRLAATIEHPNIVAVYDAGDVEGVLYIAMRFVRGTDLAATLAQRGPLAVGEALSVLEQVAAALDAAHAAGLVHRDVKPANVLIENERCYLTDFGLTKPTDETRPLTMTGQFLGTVDYIAPEQIEGRALDGRADEYALGCVLFECLTGSRPYVRDSQIAVLYAQLREPPPRPTALRPDLPAAFDAVIERTLAKDPGGRYPSCGAMAAAARQASTGPVAEPARAPTTARAPTPAVPTAPLPTAPLPTAPLPAPGAPSSLPTALLPSEPATHARTRTAAPPRRRLVVPLAILALLVVAGVVAAIALSGGSSGGGGGSSAGAPRVVGPPLEVGARPVGVASSHGFLWVADAGAGSVTRIKPDGSGRALVHVGSEPWGVASNSTSVWVASGVGNSVTRIDASTLAASTVAARPHPLFLTADDRVVYVSNASDGSVSTLDARTGAATGPPIPVGHEPLAIVAGGGSVWVANRDSGTVSRISGRRVVGQLAVGGRPVGLLYRDGVLWVADVGTDSVVRVDIGSGGMQRTKVGRKPYALGFFDGAVWVTNREDGTVWRLDPATGRRIGDPIGVPGDPVSMTSDDSGNVWVASHATGRLTRIEP